MAMPRTTLLILTLLIALVAIVLVPRADAAGTALRGSVEQGGTPVPSVWVILTRDDAQVAKALTGDDGRFYIANLRMGTYGVRVTGLGGRILFSGSVSLPLAGTYAISL